MGRIQSSVGLITGVPIQDTVDQLIAVSAQPRDSIISRNTGIKQEQVAVTELTALVIGVQFAADRLGGTGSFDARQAASSNSDSLSIITDGQPALGNYQFTPVRKAQNHQLLSSGVSSTDATIGTGSISIRRGGFVDQAVDLSELNGGAGVSRGKIRITDRSGDTAVIDLRFAKTVDDVLTAINDNDDIDVTAAATGDAFTLVDRTGQTAANLKVEDLSGGSTAADLGLNSINGQSSDVKQTGADLVSLFESQQLSRLNNGAGVRVREFLDDIDVTFRNGESVSLDLSSGGVPETIGELITRINDADSRLTAQISSNGDYLELVDNTTGSGTFAVSNATGSTVASALGLDGSAAGDTLTSRRLQSGLKTTLLTSLNGGDGLGTIGDLELTDRAGSTATVDLSAAETLDEVIAAINDAGTSITATINRSRNGITLTDTSGGAGNLVVANSSDGTNTATALGLEIDDAVSTVESGGLDLQVVAESTRLDSLRGGNGITFGSFNITDSSGDSATVQLFSGTTETIGDVLDEINSQSIGVEARINEAGDGILLIDTASGSGTLTVNDSAAGTAAELGIAGTATTLTDDGESVEGINGSTTFQVDVSASDTLQDVVDKLNALGADVNASIIDDGNGTNSQHVSLVSQIDGSAGELLIDTEGISLSFRESSAAQDALLVVGGTGQSGGGLLSSSSTNTFGNVLNGAVLTVEETSTTAVTISVEPKNDGIVGDVQLLVDQFNKLRDKLDELTAFDETTNSTGVLFGSNVTLRVESDLARIFSGRVGSAGSIRSFEEIGVSIRDDGKLEFSRTKFEQKLNGDRDAVLEFFTTEKDGVSDRLHDSIESLAGAGNSLLVSRSSALQRKIELNDRRITDYNARLERQRTRLLTEFFNLENVIGKLQNNLTAVGQIQAIPPLVRTSS